MRIDIDSLVLLGLIADRVSANLLNRDTKDDDSKNRREELVSVEVISTAPLVPLTISTDPTGHASSFVFSLDTEIHSESTPAGTSPQLPGTALNVGTIHPGVATPLSSVPFQPESSPLRSSVPPPVFNSLHGVPTSLSSIPHIPESSLLGGSFLSSPLFSIISSQSSLGVPLDTTAHHSPPKSPVLSSTSTTLPGSHTTSHSQLTADSFSIILGNPRISRPTETIVLPTSSSPVPISIGITVGKSSYHRSSNSTGVTVSTSSNHRPSSSTGSIASEISHLRSSSSTSKFQTSPTTQSLIAIPISSSTSGKTSTDNQVPGISTSISSSAVHNVTSTSSSMSPTSQITSLESKGSSSDAAPSSESSTESAPHETPQSEVQTKSADSSSEPASIQTIISTVTAPGVSPSPVTLVTTVEASPSQGDSGEITPTQPPKTENPPAPHTSEAPQPFPTSYIWDAVIGGQTYHLPAASEPPSTIILADGQKAQLSHDSIKVGDTEITQEELSQGGTVNGVAVHKQEGDAPPPQGKNHDHGGGGGAFIGGLLGGLVGGATKAASGVKDAGAAALKLSSGAVGGAAAAGVGKTLSTAGQGVNDLVSGLNGIQKAFPKDATSQAGLGAALDAQNMGLQVSNWLTSTGNLVQNFQNFEAGVKDQVIGDTKKFAGEGGLLGKTRELRFRIFQNIDGFLKTLATEHL